jgi:hypothetical protein
MDLLFMLGTACVIVAVYLYSTYPATQAGETLELKVPDGRPYNLPGNAGKGHRHGGSPNGHDKNELLDNNNDSDCEKGFMREHLR